jgi:hypothetical protein
MQPTECMIVPKADTSKDTGDAAAIVPAIVPAMGHVSGAARLLNTPVSVINVGLQSFADDLAGQGVPVVHVQWQPPAGGDPYLAGLLAKLGR